MHSAKGNIKPYAIAAICVLAVVAVILAGTILNTPHENPELPTRENAIPTGAIKSTPETDIYPPILNSGEWNQPIPIAAAVNTAGGEDSPFILPDGNTLYFFFTPNVTVPAEKQLLDGVTGIYTSKKENGEWMPAERVKLQDAGKLALDGAQFIQDDTMWFASAREGYTGVNLFTARLVVDKWMNWQYVGDKLMKDYQVGEMHITADGNTMYFHSGRTGGLGGLDIWTTQKVNGEWQTPKHVEAVNSPEDEGWPFVSQDGTELWFTRTYNGSPGIYRSTKLNGVWQEAELVVSQFAGEPTLDEEGNLYFVHHFFNNQGKMLEADIYVATKKQRGLICQAPPSLQNKGNRDCYDHGDEASNND